MRYIYIIILLFFTSFVYGQTLEVTADKNPAIVGEQIIIQYKVNTKGNNFKSPNFNGLRVLSGPNPSTQSSFTYVNGKSQRNSSTSYSFFIKASREGIYNLSPATILVNGKTIKSKGYRLEVVKAKQKNNTQQKTLSNNLFIKVKVSKRNIVVGEQILISYKLFTRIDLHSTELSELPSLNGFWAKDLEASSRFKRDIVDGIAYNVATIKKSVLTAQKSGKLILDPLTIKCGIRIQNKSNSRDPFANFFGGGYQIQEELISSNSITINVSDIPNPPSNFNGIVGDVNIKSSIDKSSLSANDALTYKVTITGTGNIELIKPLTIKFPKDFEVYDPKITDKIFEGGRQRSVKTFEYLLIPRYKGEYEIPTSDLIFYNPKSKNFVTKTSANHKISVSENRNKEEEKFGINQQIVKTTLKDINYIYRESEFYDVGESYINKITFFIFYLIIITLFIILWIYLKIAPNNLTFKNMKNRRANKVALKRLKSVKDCIKNNDFDKFFEEIEKSLWGYFAEKFKIQISELSKETINIYFSSVAINSDIKTEFITLLDECEFARYAPSNNKNAQMDVFLKKAINIIIKVENAIR